MSATETQKVNILVVDDQPANLLALEAVLGSPDYNLVYAHSGAEALNLVERIEFALILLDVQMPVMDGYETAQRIKSNPRHRDIPIIFITAIYRDESKILQGYATGAVDYFNKPFEPKILRSKVRIYADLFRMNAELQTKNEQLEARSRALEESEARTQAVLKNIKDAIVTLDAEGLIASLSPAFERQTGFKRAAWLGRPFLLLIHPDDAGPTMRRFQNTIHGREESVFEARLNRADGSHVLLEISCTPLLDEDTVKGAIGVFRDISDRKRAEVHEAEHKKLKAVLEQLPVGVVIFSKDAKVVMHNRQMESILNAPLASSDIRGFTELDLPTFRLDGTPYEPHERPAFRSLNFGETVIGEEMAFYRLDGKQAIISINTAPIRNERGEIVYVVSVCADVTESKRSQEELRRRTEELAASNAELDHFAAVAAHDLKSPLISIIQFSDLLKNHLQIPESDDGSDYLNFIVNAARRMSELVDSLLTLARLGKAIPNLQEVESRFVVERAIGNLRAVVETSGAAISFQSLPVVCGDHVQLTQLFQNLIANAIKFSGGKRPEIAIEAEQADGKWKFTVRDNGIGIAREHQERVFERFERAHASADGTGLGLSICKRIVEAHGGKIGVTSAPGEGSVFCFTLPGPRIPEKKTSAPERPTVANSDLMA